jgi:hypothetical protein
MLLKRAAINLRTSAQWSGGRRPPILAGAVLKLYNAMPSSPSRQAIEELKN